MSEFSRIRARMLSWAAAWTVALACQAQTAEAPSDVQPRPAARAFCLFVPQRADDFAWENDRIAFRVYGPALEKKDGPQSGIDVWVKSVRTPVLQKWYASGDYHKDRGEGLDCYKVGTARGCGGLGIWDGERLATSGNFDAWKVLENGPDRVRFQLTYKPWKAGGLTVKETRTVELACGSNLNRIESLLEADGQEPLTVGIGIARREGAGGELKQDRERGLLGYWEPAAPPNGSVACGVLADPSRVTGFAETKTDHLILVRVEPGKPFVYRTGAGWSKSGDFADAVAWFEYLGQMVHH